MAEEKIYEGIKQVSGTKKTPIYSPFNYFYGVRELKVLRYTNLESQESRFVLFVGFFEKNLTKATSG